MSCIFQPQELTWEDIDGGCGEELAMMIDDFTAELPIFDSALRSSIMSAVRFTVTLNGKSTSAYIRLLRTLHVEILRLCLLSQKSRKKHANRRSKRQRAHDQFRR